MNGEGKGGEKQGFCLSERERERMNSIKKRRRGTGRQADSSVCLCQATLAYYTPIDARGSAIDLVRVNGIGFMKKSAQMIQGMIFEDTEVKIIYIEGRTLHVSNSLV